MREGLRITPTGRILIPHSYSPASVVGLMLPLPVAVPIAQYIPCTAELMLDTFTPVISSVGWR